MAVNAKIIYNFNENDTSTIRDYSENGNDGTGSGLTNQASARVGYDIIFNATTDQISMGNITYLSGAASMGLHLGGLIVTGTTGTGGITKKASQFIVTYNYTTGILTAALFVATGTATVTAALSVDVTYDVDITYTSNVLTIYVDGVSIDTDSTKSGVIDSNANTMYMGYDGTNNSAFFKLNEYKLYNEVVTTTMIDAFIAEPNGVSMTSFEDGEFQTGDVIVANYELTPLYAVVGYAATREARIYPISDNITTGLSWQRVGNVYDTTRQWSLLIDDTPKICFYDNVTKSSEVFTDSKKTHCLDRNGLVKNSTSVTTTYQALSTDQRLYVDSTGGAFTITLESSPSTNREIEIMDSVGNCGTDTVTINGNGNNIIGNTTALMNSNYISYVMVYNGVEWNLK